MATKDISDLQVIKAYLKFWDNIKIQPFPYIALMKQTGQCMKVCYRACERAERNGYIDYGVSLRTGWVTEKGIKLIHESEDK